MMMMQSKIKGSEYKCEICYREISKTNHGIPRHMLVVHLTCSKCSQSFPSGEEVKQHLVKKHRSVYSCLFEKSRRNIQCNRCQAEFARSCGLRPHKLVVHFECQLPRMRRSLRKQITDFRTFEKNPSAIIYGFS